MMFGKLRKRLAERKPVSQIETSDLKAKSPNWTQELTVEEWEEIKMSSYLQEVDLHLREAEEIRLSPSEARSKVDSRRHKCKYEFLVGYVGVLEFYCQKCQSVYTMPRHVWLDLLKVS